MSARDRAGQGRPIDTWRFVLPGSLVAGAEGQEIRDVYEAILSRAYGKRPVMPVPNRCPFWCQGP